MGHKDREEAIKQLRVGRELANVENIGRRAMRGFRMKTEGDVRDYLRDAGSKPELPASAPLHVLVGHAALWHRAAVENVTPVGKYRFDASFEKESDALERVQLADAFAKGQPWMHMLRVAGTDTYNLLLPVTRPDTTDMSHIVGCLSHAAVLELPCRALLLPVRNDYWACVVMMDLEEGIAAYAKLPPKSAKGEEDGAE